MVELIIKYDDFSNHQKMINATKKYVQFKIKKTMNLTWKDRDELLKPLAEKLEELVKDRVFYVDSQSLTDVDVKNNGLVLLNSINYCREYVSILTPHSID